MPRRSPSLPLRPGPIVAILAALLSAAPLLAQDQPQRPDPEPPAPATDPEEQPQPQTKPATSQRDDLPLPRQIIEQSLQAMGGREAFDNMTSSFAKATLMLPTGQVQLEMSWMKPDRILVRRLGEGGEQATVSFNGEVAWARDNNGYQILPTEQATLLQREASMFRLVPRMETDLRDLRTVDKLQFAGAECYKVLGIDFEGAEHITYFDVATHLVRGTEVTGGPNQSTLTSRFSEWKEDAGIKYFSKVEIEPGDGDAPPITLTFTEVKFNTLDESVFALPPEIEAMLKDRQAPMTAPAPTRIQPATTPASEPDDGGSR